MSIFSRETAYKFLLLNLKDQCFALKVNLNF